jgi:hypothetical protein
MTKADELALWCKEKKLFSKADLHKYGYENYYLRAWRTVCEWVTQNRVRKLEETECLERGLTTAMAWYEWREQAPARILGISATPIPTYAITPKQAVFF